MPSKISYNNVYEEVGNAARKIKEIEVKPEKKGKINTAKRTKSKMMVVPFVLSLFAMTLVITCRYTTINEKNLETIRLKKQLEKAESALFSAQIAVEQNTDLSKIEAYAKQQLGMQKPTKNQLIYIDTSENTGVIEKIENTNFFSDVKNNILVFIKNIF